MSLVIEFSPPEEARLQAAAAREGVPVADIIRKAVANYLPSSNEAEVAAGFQVAPPDPRNLRLARGSLADALRAAPRDPDFDLAQWNREWAAVEAEMKAVTHTNDVAEGRG
jgi:hypothetical protein